MKDCACSEYAECAEHQAGYWSLSDAAARLGLSAATLRWQVKNGKLRARKIGPIWTVSDDEVERYARENRRPS
jgi:excisionase family DNA binding protein